MQVEVTMECVSLVQEDDEILQAAAEPIQAPCCDHVDLARGGGLAPEINRRGNHDRER